MSELEQSQDIEAVSSTSSSLSLSYINPSDEAATTHDNRVEEDEEDMVAYVRPEPQQKQQEGEEVTFSILQYEFQIGGVKRLKLHVVGRVLTIGLWIGGIVPLVIWQFMAPFNVGIMATGYTFLTLAILFSCIVSLFNNAKNRERTLLYSIHRLFFLCISAFLIILNVTLWHLKVASFMKRMHDNMRHPPTVFNLWAIYPILFWGHIFIFHYMREFKTFNWWEYHKFSFTAVNSALLFIWALGHYNAPYTTEDPWFLGVLIPWALIITFHFLIMQVDWNHGVTFTFWGFNFHASRTAASDKREA